MDNEFEKLKDARIHAQTLYETAHLEYRIAAKNIDDAEANYHLAWNNFQYNGLTQDEYFQAWQLLSQAKEMFDLAWANRSNAAHAYNDACDAEAMALHELNASKGLNDFEFLE